MQLGLPTRPTGLRAVGVFWAGIVGAAAVAAVTMQVLGPPTRRAARPLVADAHRATEPPSPVAAKAPHPAAPAAPVAPVAHSVVAARPGRQTPGPIEPPRAALLESSSVYPGKSLPRIAPDGSLPAQVYARGFDTSDPHPRIGILLAGVGLNGADSEDAIRSLPGEITLAFSPYAARPERLLELSRTAGHEFLVGLPMEPQGYPLNDAGDHALLTGASPERNGRELQWALTRIGGYVGATGAAGVLRGERFANSATQLGSVLQTLASRGLVYVDPRPGQPALPQVWGRDVDLVIDEPAVGSEIEAKLAALEQIARDKGSALGLAGAVRPVTIGRLAAWANGLAAKGLALAPVTALVTSPPTVAAAR